MTFDTGMIAAALRTWDDREVLLRCLFLGCIELHYPEIGKVEVVMKRDVTEDPGEGEEQEVIDYTLEICTTTGAILKVTPENFSEDLRVTYLEMTC